MLVADDYLLECGGAAIVVVDWFYSSFYALHLAYLWLGMKLLVVIR